MPGKTWVRGWLLHPRIGDGVLWTQQVSCVKTGGSVLWFCHSYHPLTMFPGQAMQQYCQLASDELGVLVWWCPTCSWGWCTLWGLVLDTRGHWHSASKSCIHQCWMGEGKGRRWSWWKGGGEPRMWWRTLRARLVRSCQCCDGSRSSCRRSGRRQCHQRQWCWGGQGHWKDSPQWLVKEGSGGHRQVTNGACCQSICRWQVAQGRWAAGRGDWDGGEVIATTNYLGICSQQRAAVLVELWGKGQIKAVNGVGRILVEGLVVPGSMWSGEEAVSAWVMIDQGQAGPLGGKGRRSDGVGVQQGSWRSPRRGSLATMVEVHCVVRWRSRTIVIPTLNIEVFCIFLMWAVFGWWPWTDLL